jgi:hypothetical protein
LAVWLAPALGAATTGTQTANTARTESNERR